jgi:hypothetical protein
MKNKHLDLVFLAVFLLGCQQSAWKEFNSSEGAFSVLVPGTPKEQTINVNIEGTPIDCHFFMLEQKDMVYLVAYADYPEALIHGRALDAILDGARDGAVANCKGRLLGESTISLNQYLGRELKIESPDGESTMKARIFMVGRRLYQVEVATPKEKDFSKNIGKFLDSFKLLEK